MYLVSMDANHTLSRIQLLLLDTDSVETRDNNHVEVAVSQQV